MVPAAAEGKEVTITAILIIVLIVLLIIFVAKRV
jgi:hypothetical protein